MTRPLSARLGLAPALLALALTAAPAAAQTDYFWNAPTGGTGTWDITTQLWSTTATGPVDYTWTNSGTERANFGNTAGTVTLGTGITAYGLNFSTSGYTVTGNTLTLAGAGGVIDTGASNATINSVIAGSVGLTKNGTGTLVLGGSNTFTGSVAVNAGTLSVSADANLGTVPVAATAGSIVLNTGTLLATSSFTLNANRGMTIGTGVSGGTGTINVANGQTLTYNGVIANNSVASQLNKTGAGTLVLGGTNTYSGGTLITDGTVLLTNVNALGNTAGLISLKPVGATDASLLINIPAANSIFARSMAIGDTNDTGSGRVVLGTDVFSAGGSFETLFSGPLSLRRSVTLQAGNSFRTRFNGAITVSGTSATDITISAPTANRKVVFDQGTQTNANVYGNLTIGDSFGPHAAFQIGNGTASNNKNIPDTSNILFFAAPSGTNQGSQFIIAPGSAMTDGETVGALISLAAGAGTITTITPSSGAHTFTLTVGGGNQSGTFSGVVGQGTGTGNAVVAITKIGTGTQTFSGVANTYSGPTTISGGVLSVTTLANGGSNSSIGKSDNTAASLVLNGGTLQYTGGDVSTDRLFTLGAGASAGTLDASGTGAVNFSNTGNVAFTGSGTRTLTLTGSNTGANTLAAVLGDDASGATSLAKSGAGTWVLTGASTYTGSTTINAGTLQLGGDNRLPAGTVVNFGTAAPATLDMTNRQQTITGLNGNTATSSSVLLGNGTLTLNDPPAGNSIYSGTIAGAGGTVNKTGTGLLILNGANTFTGGLTIGGGTVQIGFNDAGGSLAPGLPITNNGTLAVYKTNALLLDGVISGTGGLQKLGGGTLTLSGANTYGGATTIIGGTVLVNGNQSAATGAVSVGGVLGGTGTAGGAVSVSSGGRVQGGDGTAAGQTLSVGSNLTVANNGGIRAVVGDGATFNNTTTTGASRVAVAGAFGRSAGTSNTVQIELTLDNINSFDLSGSTVYTRRILTYGSLGSFLAAQSYTSGGTDPEFNVTGTNFTVSPGWQVVIGQGGNFVDVQFIPVPVPEPAAVLAAAAAGLGLAGVGRRVRRRATAGGLS